MRRFPWLGTGDRGHRRVLLAAAVVLAAIGSLILTVALTCHPGVLEPTADDDASLAMESQARGRTPGGQAHLHLTLEDCASVYAGNDPHDAWRSESWTTTSGSFVVVVTNHGSVTVQSPRLLVAVPSDQLAMAGWQIELDDLVLLDHPAHFPDEDPATANFGAGIHGVYRPSGNARYATYTSANSLAPGTSWRVHVDVCPGGVAGFTVHFDAASDRYFSPNGHDVNVRAETPGECDQPVGEEVVPEDPPTQEE